MPSESGDLTGHSGTSHLWNILHHLWWPKLFKNTHLIFTVMSWHVCRLMHPLHPQGGIRYFAFYTTSLSSLCRITLKYWTYNMIFRYIMSSVCLRSNPFSQDSFMENIWGSVFPPCPSSFWWLWGYLNLFESYYHHQIGYMNQLAIVKDKVMKQWYELNVTLCSYILNGFPSQRTTDVEFDILFDSNLNKLLNNLCKTAVTPLLTHWSYCSLALSYRDAVTLIQHHCM